MNEASRIDTIRDIIEQMRRTIVAAYLDLLALGVEDPSVIVLDLRDGAAGAMGCVLHSEQMVAGAILEARRLGKAPRLVVGLSRRELVALLGAFTAIDASRLDGDDRVEGFQVAVVAHGEAGLVDMPIPG
jgi:hypothetical protein